MKRWYLYILLVAFAACSSNSDSFDEMEMEEEEEMMMEVDETAANFVSDAHPTSGTASLSEDGKTLSLTNFKSDDGPLLELYLATDLTATTYLSLGELKGLNGNYQYSIPEGTDLESLKYVIVWCVDFKVSFGHAVLP